MNIDLLPTDFNGKCWRFTEECSEVIKCLSKMQRFGFRNHKHDNVKEALEEIADLKHAIEELEKELVTK